MKTGEAQINATRHSALDKSLDSLDQSCFSKFLTPYDSPRRKCMGSIDCGGRKKTEFEFLVF